MKRLVWTVVALVVSAGLPPARTLLAQNGDLATVDHYVRVKSTVPAIAGQVARLYVRERADAAALLRSASFENRVVLFVHGAGTPAEVAFDVPYADYSWMAYLAAAGFDVFSMDVTGYGRSTRPWPMDDPCNLSREEQAVLVPGLLAAPCAPTHDKQLTTVATDWNDIGAVVDYVRALRHVDRLALVAWSRGGPRAGGYASRHPERVSRLVFLAPGYDRGAPAGAPDAGPASGAPMNKQSRVDFTSNWDRQVGCADQYEPAAADAIWRDMLRSDPVGTTWGPGVRRAPNMNGTWTPAMVASLRVPTLMVTGAHDKQVAPDRVRDFYADLGATDKVFVDLACSSHNAMWERNHLLLFEASRQWLAEGAVNGTRQGMLRLGYAPAATARTN
ncbi:MAG: alpha/beta fold hydrolase [Acidobacteria bacterium]|nr:alpha/beta fold hydrolase [Acidobacteriota bacterium]